MRFVLLMMLLFVPSLSYGMSKEVSYDTNGIKKQNIKKNHFIMIEVSTLNLKMVYFQPIYNGELK